MKRILFVLLFISSIASAQKTSDLPLYNGGGIDSSLFNGFINNTNRKIYGADIAKINKSRLDSLVAALNGKVPTTRTLSINGTTLDLSANRSWTIPGGNGTDLGWIVPTGLVNDSTVDNATAINNAVNTVSTAGGGTVFIPKGHFGLASRINVKDNVRIIGAGMNKTVFHVLPTFDVSDPTYAYVFKSFGSSYLYFSDFSITGKHLFLGGGISMESKDWLDAEDDNQERVWTIERVEFINFWAQGGIRFGSTQQSGDTHGASEINILNCHFLNMHDTALNLAVTGAAENAEFSNGIYLTGTAKRINIIGNFFKNLDGDAIFGGNWYSTVSPNVPPVDFNSYIIAFNQAENCRIGIELTGYLANTRSLITSNILLFMNRPTGGAYGISSGCYESIITDNLIINVETQGLEVGGTKANISGNTVISTVRLNQTPIGKNPTYINDPASYLGIGQVSSTAARLSDNLFICNLRYSDSTVSLGLAGGITLSGQGGMGGSTPPYDLGTVDDYEILNNTFIGFNVRALTAPLGPILNPKIKGNTFSTKYNIVNGVIMIQGYNWLIENNVFDVTGISNTGNTLVQVHTGVQSDNTKSLVHRNTIMGNGWTIAGSTQYTAFNNDYIDASGIASSGMQTLTDGATITFNPGSGETGIVTLAGNRTLAIQNPAKGRFYTLIVKQDATGSRTLALPAGSKVPGTGAGAITLSTAANAVDILSVFWDGTNYYWSYGKSFN